MFGLVKKTEEAQLSSAVAVAPGLFEFHPLADEFPLFEGEAFNALVASIARDGLLEPILLCAGKILDGRNRYRACLAAGVKPIFEVFGETDPEAWARFVAAKNLTRRHLNEAQRAMIGARFGISDAEAGKRIDVWKVTARDRMLTC